MCLLVQTVDCEYVKHLQCGDESAASLAYDVDDGRDVRHLAGEWTGDTGITQPYLRRTTLLQPTNTRRPTTSDRLHLHLEALLDERLALGIGPHSSAGTLGGLLFRLHFAVQLHHLLPLGGLSGRLRQ